ncbi:MAG: sn-glycerol-1-phosphate dehydrogenase [Candidatus Caldarchaeum sp.]|nr:sn-glycerol-1-phosphate dehydrogenase [Candidatus Caldarchaeum sp.]
MSPRFISNPPAKLPKMLRHEMELPQYIVIGHDLVSTIVERLKSNHAFRKILLITSKTPYRAYGSKVVEYAGSSLDFEVFYVDEAVEGFGKLVEHTRGSDAVVGIGGGKVLDVSKALAEAGERPFFSVPTVASHDGIASPMTSFRRNGRAYSRKSVMPLEIYADMEVISMAPRRYLLSGCGDLVAKHSAVRDWWLAHVEKGEYYGRYAAHLANLSASVIMKSAKHIVNDWQEGVRTVVEALISAGVAMGVAGSSRPCSGSEHLIAHALETMMEKPALHGERCGVATIFTSKLHKSNWEKVRNSLKTIGAPHTLNQIGVDADLFVEAVKKAPDLRKERYTILHKTPLTSRQIYDALQETMLV